VAGCELGTLQQIIFIDPDNRPRNRKLIVQVIGSDPRGIPRIDQDGMGFVKPGIVELPHHLADSPTHGGFICGGGSDLFNMERGELCRDRCTGMLLLAEYMQDRGAARPNAKSQCTSLGLKCGVS
jgi:hypothetical protein